MTIKGHFLCHCAEKQDHKGMIHNIKGSAVCSTFCSRRSAG